MHDALRTHIHAWIGSLNALIGDTEEEIRKRRELNHEAVRVREDVAALVEYIEHTPMPPPVYRALAMCLRWNPHAQPK